jgi:hypothetical protein
MGETKQKSRGGPQRPAHENGPGEPHPVAPITINPTENNFSLKPGDGHTETIVVTIPPSPGGQGYRSVKLVAAGATAVFVVSITPPSYGPLSPRTSHELKFEVTFRGAVPCKDVEQVFVGSLDVIADDRLVAQKRVRIVVPACPQERFVYTYSVKFICGEQPACQCECTSVRPGIYATEINIHNYQEKEVKIGKRVTPLVLAGAVIGREPRIAVPRATDRIILPPHSATMDDCCRLAELLFGGNAASSLPLTVGFLEITSLDELAVTAVYTVSDLTSGAVSIDVEQINVAKVKLSAPEPPVPGVPTPPPPPHHG